MQLIQALTKLLACASYFDKEVLHMQSRLNDELAELEQAWQKRRAKWNVIREQIAAFKDADEAKHDDILNGILRDMAAGMDEVMAAIGDLDKRISIAEKARIQDILVELGNEPKRKGAPDADSGNQADPVDAA